MNSSDTNDATQPAAPEQVSCAICQKELPSKLALTAEGEEYRLWFCSSECYVQWQRDKPAQDEN